LSEFVSRETSRWEHVSPSGRLFHVKREPSPSDILLAASSMGLKLTQGEVDGLLHFMALLTERAGPLGLISRGDISRLYERHVLDSLRAAALFTPEDALAYDLGSGAGLPGIVLAIAVPRCRFVLLEPRRIRVGFLELAVEALELTNVEVTAVRAEELGPRRLGDVVTARAFAPLARTWPIASRLLQPSGRLIYFAGKSLVNPLAEAEEAARRGPSADVRAERVLARSPPLVIMARR
jgi:16S rRNA (guanine527-N7)-methyltransferase